ncbi:MAG: PD40 domain-containing protein [Kordiimonadaceae bacterium]|nr:PD40 domain-containing protein [Kordiimonadaceae bacterium]MBO6569385.1 PD40 domain-containing protein [Kordiimonadaceae bacterium]MBO6964860.1 PD40 domain-containing protein [Kordiimonadaceae bacterium]
MPGITRAAMAALSLTMATGSVALDSHQSPYLGQVPPGDTPKLFAPGMVNTGAVELNSVFSPDGKEFFFTRMIDGPDEQQGYPGKGRLILFHTTFSYGGWNPPKSLRLYPGSPHTWAADMSLSPDGQRLYFMGPYEPETGGEGNLNIWVSEKGEDGAWQPASPLPAPINTDAQEVYSSVIADGSLYFTTYANGDGDASRDGLHRAQAKVGGGFEAPVPVQIPGGNSVGDTFVAPDESYLIFSSERAGGIGGGDLYISYRAADGSWGAPINMGPEVNTERLDYCPVVSRDGKYFFFSRRTSEPANGGWRKVVAGDVYWMSADIIERLRP